MKIAHRFILVILFFQLSLGSFAKTQENIFIHNTLKCSATPDELAIRNAEMYMSKICINVLIKNNLPLVDNKFEFDDILPMIGACTEGIGAATLRQIRGYGYLIKLFLREIPLAVFKTMRGSLEKDKSIEIIADVSEENSFGIDEARKKADECIVFLKDFLRQFKVMLEKQFKEFFCYPKELQAQMLCKLITSVILFFYFPSTSVKGFQVVKNMPDLLRKSLNIFLDSGAMLGNGAYKLDLVK